MLFLPAPSGTWEVLLYRRGLAGAPVLVEDGSRLYRPVDKPPEDLEPGECRWSEFRRDGLGEDTALVFRPFDSANPNLDGRHYAARIGEAELAARWPRRTEPLPDSDCLDFRRHPRLMDFARCFWRDREAELWPIAEPGHTAIGLRVTGSGAGSLMTSLTNSGWAPTEIGMHPDLLLRAMHGLSVGAREFDAPAYPQLLTQHYWSQTGAVIPGARHFALLREPVRRLVSLHGWASDHGSEPLGLDRFIDQICDEGFPDFQICWFAHMAGALNHSLLDWVTIPDYIEVGAAGMRMTPHLAKTADAALARFFFVGLTEMFDQSLCLLSLLMRIPTVGRWRRINRSSASDGFALAPATRARLERHIAPELEFHARLRRHFLDHYADELAFLDANLDSLEI